MKNLGLLCVLHAEGPATLNVLRRDGCDGIQALLDYEVRDLARLLEWDEARAERFLREAQELGERLEVGFFESELAPFEEEATELEGENGEDEDGEEAADEEEYEGQNAAVTEVLDAWRGLDENEPPPAPPARDAEGFVLPRPDEKGERGPKGSEGPPGRSTPLRALAVDGLDQGLLAKLTACGVESAEDLELSPPLELATRLEIGLTRVLRLQFLVRRALRTGSADPVTTTT